MSDNRFSVIKVANLEDEANCNAYEIFQFKTVSGDTRSLSIDRRQSRRVQHVYRELLLANAALPLYESDALSLIQAATETDPGRHMVHAATLGWRPRGDGFVLRDKCVGLSDRVLPPVGVDKTAAADLRYAGDLRSWQQRVAQPASRSSRLVLVISAAFAAPLLRWTGMQNFGIGLFGLTTEERETAAMVAASVIGRDIGRSVPDWWVAPDDLVRRAAGHADLLFVATAGSPPSGSRGSPTLQEMRLERLRSGEVRHERRSSRWRGLFLFILADAAPQGRFVESDREMVEAPSCVEVPLRSTHSGLFDLHSAPGSKTSGCAPQRRPLSELRRAMSKQYGRPIRAYLRYLIKHRDTLAAVIRKSRAEFREYVVAQNVPKAGHEADRFSLLYAGGCMAIRAKLLPWSQEQLQSALLVCLRDAVQHRRAHELTPAAIAELLSTRLTSPNVVARTHTSRFGPDQHAGFHEMIDGQRVFTVHATALRRWFGATRCRSVLLWLHHQELLMVGDRQVTPSPNSTEWAERTPRWPDGSVQKSFVFRWPEE